MGRRRDFGRDAGAWATLGSWGATLGSASRFPMRTKDLGPVEYAMKVLKFAEI